jgi:sugar lactone lactonase YvrE
MRDPRVGAGQPGWWPVSVAAGGPARASVSARRSASGSRYRPTTTTLEAIKGTRGTTAIAITPNGTTAYVTGYVLGRVIAIRTATNSRDV